MYCIAISIICLKILCKGELDMVSKIGKVVLTIVGMIVVLVAAFYFVILLTAWLAPLIVMLGIVAIVFGGFKVLMKR